MMNYDTETGCLPAEAMQHKDVLFKSFSDTQTRFFDTELYCYACGEFWEDCYANGRLCKSSNGTKGCTSEDREHGLMCPPVTEAQQAHHLQLLRTFDVVGTTSDLDGFGKRVLAKMGFPPKAFADFNVS